jgi:hypothetical protein
LELNNKIRKISGLFMMMLVVSMVLVTPTLACPAGTNCGSDSVPANPIQLTGADKDKMLSTALSDSNVKKYQEQLINEGYTQNGSTALVIPVENKNDSSITEIKFAAISFKNDKSQEPNKTILYSYNPQTKTSTTVVINSLLSDCVFNLSICLGSAATCVIICGPLLAPNPATPLEVKLCLACIPIGVGACGLAYTACHKYYYGN